VRITREAANEARGNSMSAQSQVTEPVVVCPKCQNVIPLTKALTGPIESQVARRLEAQYQAREREILDGFKQQLATEQKKAASKARSDQAVEVAAMKEQLAEQAERIAQHERVELQLRKRTRDLEAKEKALGLEVERKVDERAKAIEATVAEQYRLKDLKWEKQFSDLRAQVEEANRKAQQGSQQLQGEVAEGDVEAQLRQAFPQDQITAVAVGQRGADILHKVVDAGGKVVGSILYEVKNTKAFSDTWLPKLRDDQRSVSAEIAVLVTQSLPKEVATFAQRGSVWVTGFGTWLPLAYALRCCVAEAARARLVAEGQTEKQATLLAYCGGTEFRQRIEAMAEGLAGLMSEINRGRRGMESLCARQTKLVEQVARAMAGLYGDVGGITGTLPKLGKLELPPGDSPPGEAA
jgi:hypothetical protein